ncbi:MAG: 2-oxo acid dehydrogenase subunit E2, partial [Betaproteobacteria bacterium]
MSASEVLVPDIGDFKEIPVIEVLVKVGDVVARDESLITLESDKATLEVPSPEAGVVKALKVKIGDRLSEGSPVLTLEVAESPAATPLAPGDGPGVTASIPPPGSASLPPGEEPQASDTTQQPPSPTTSTSSDHHASGPESHPIAAPVRVDEAGFTKAHASPAIRAFARELGVDLAKVRGSGPYERILRDDVQDFVRGMAAAAEGKGASAGTAGTTRGAGLDLLPWPRIDFGKFGPVESCPLSRIRKISGANLARNWVMIPHVTQHDDADITDLEAFRVRMNAEYEKSGTKITLLAFLIKAVVAALRAYPEFNASLDGENLVLKKYFHIGFAADTPNGLVVPVIRDAADKGVAAIAQEMTALSAKAREGKLAPADMQGGCFSISSLGGIGGTYF